MRFSQRIGKTSARLDQQEDEMDLRLRNKLLNFIEISIENYFTWAPDGVYSVKDDFRYRYCDFFGERFKDVSYNPEIFTQAIEAKSLLSATGVWFIYDFLEWLIFSFSERNRQSAIKIVNTILEQERSAFRVATSGELIKLTTDVELEEVDGAILLSSKYKGVYEHLEKARKFFSIRDTPDYSNTVKESVCAIESLAKIISSDPNATLDKALEKVQLTNINLKEAIKKLYHFRGDEGGVVHGSKSGQKSTVSEADAKLVLVIAHAITSYLIASFLSEPTIKYES